VTQEVELYTIGIHLSLSAHRVALRCYLFEHLCTTEVWATWREVHPRLQVLGCAAFCPLVLSTCWNSSFWFRWSNSVCFAEYSAIHLLLFFSLSSSPFCFNRSGAHLHSKAFCVFSIKLQSLSSSLSCCSREEVSSKGRSCFTLKEEKLYVLYHSRGKSCIFSLCVHLCSASMLPVLTDSEVTRPPKRLLITLVIVL